MAISTEIVNLHLWIDGSQMKQKTKFWNFAPLILSQFTAYGAGTESTL